MNDSDLKQIAEAAIAWDAARREALRLKAERDPIECELRCDLVPDQCWKARCQDETEHEQGTHYHTDRATWCSSCLQRQSLHEQYQAATKRRGALLRNLRRLIGRVALVGSAT